MAPNPKQPYQYQEFPRYMFHPTNGSIVVNNQAEKDDAADAGHFETEHEAAASLDKPSKKDAKDDDATKDKKDKPSKKDKG